MGFSFRKAMKLGPLRVNLSTRGVGLSGGVRGARVSVGPRGTYVTLGRGGFQYRVKLNNRQHVTPVARWHAPVAATPGAPAQQPQVHGAGYIHSAAVEALAVSSPDATLMDAQRRVGSFAWFSAYLICAAAFLFVCLLALPFWATLILGLLAVGCAVPVYLWDRERRTARIIYDVDDPAVLERLAMCNAAAEWLAYSARIWHIFYSVATTDWKTNAGASTLLQRSATRVAPTALPGVELNIGVYSVPFGPQHLLFLPDRLVVTQGSRFAGIPYEHLLVEGRATRFIEEASTPPDAQIVDTTWRYVNKSGGPDRRFNDNRQLPVCRYGEIELATTAGLRVVLQTSNPDSAFRAAEVLSQLRSRALESAYPAMNSPAPTQPAQPAFVPGSQVATPQQHPQSTPSSNDSRTPIHLHRAIAILLRYIAVADRKLDECEVSGAVAFLASFGVTDLGEFGDLEQQFRALRSDDAAADEAANLLLREGSHLVPFVLEAIRKLAEVDGRVTPKERERLEWLNSKLSAGDCS